MHETQTPTGNVIEGVRGRLEERATELAPYVREHEQIIEALAALDGKAPSAGGGGGKRRQIAARGQRIEELYRAIQERPGRSRSDYAAFMGITSGAVHAPFRKLEEEGRVLKRGTAYYPANTG